MPHSSVTRRRLLEGGIAALALGVSGGATLAAPVLARLRLMETSDLHVNIVPYDYYRDAADDKVGLAKTATLIRAAQAEAANHLLLDNGDLIQGSPLGDYVAYRKKLNGGDVHPMMAAMNALPYACGTLGNHEFNYGLAFLDKALAGARFPIVCANVETTGGRALVKPWLVLDREIVDAAGAKHPIRIGIIGFTPPQITLWDRAHLDGQIVTRDIVEAARRHVPDMRVAGADIVVALCHSGIAGGPRLGGEENAALHLAAVEGIDVILTGHQHRVFPGPKDFDGIAGVDPVRGTLHGKPAVMPGFWGSHLGIVDLDLVRTEKSWRIADFRVEARPVYERREGGRILSRAEADAAILAAVRADHEATLAYVREPVGATRVPIHSYFSLVADDASVKLVTEAQAWYVSQLVRDTAYASLPLLSAAAPFKAGGRSGASYFTDIPPGPLAIKDLADVYVYPNTVRAVRVTGAQVREWLERSAGVFRRIDPSLTGEQELIDPTFPSYNFDVIAGVTYRIDPTQASRYDRDGKLVAPDARRILDLRHQGKPVADDQSFLVATNNYRAGGGGNFPGNDGSTVVVEAPDLVRDVIMRFVTDRREVAPSADGSWSLALPPGVTVTFLTGPGAAKHRPSGIRVEAAGEGPEGFVKYRIVA